MGWKEQFLEKMFVEKDIENGLMLYVANKPDTLFRYRQGNENDINALRNNQIWLSNMKCLNDKFEGQIEVVYEKKKFNFKFLEDALRKKVDEVMNQIISQFYVSCFCESVSKDIMWSHYANNHKGFCIEYYSDSFESPQFIFPVVYKDRKIIDIDDFDEAEMYKSIMTKYSQWSPEEEWRIILPYPGENNSGKAIEQPLPKAIYMGVDITDSLKATLREYCEEHMIELYQMEVDSVRRQLIPKQIM